MLFLANGIYVVVNTLGMIPELAKIIFSIDWPHQDSHHFFFTIIAEIVNACSIQSNTPDRPLIASCQLDMLISKSNTVKPY